MMWQAFVIYGLASLCVGCFWSMGAMLQKIDNLRAEVDRLTQEVVFLHDTNRRRK